MSRTAFRPRRPTATGPALVAVALAALALSHPARPAHSQSGPITIDPCAVASADSIRSMLSGSLAEHFPISDSRDGQHVTISDPKILDVACSPLRISIRTDIRYRKTRGVPQYSTSGDMRFNSQGVALVTVGPPAPGSTTPTVSKADACLTRINVVGLNLNRVPNWLDNTWVRDRLNGKLADTACFDVTKQVTAYLQGGGTLAASGSAGRSPTLPAPASGTRSR